jgi:prepilin-type processing-associated H-X9-DG protein
MRDRAPARQGLTFVDTLALATLSLIGSALLIIGCQYQSQGPGRQNTCRNNLRQLSLAIFQFANKTTQGNLPGYIEALERDDGYAYHDPRTKRVEPVSWVVMILPELDRQALYSIWQNGESQRGEVRTGSPPIDKTHIYLEMLVCPSDPQPNRNGTPLCYVVNAGIPDFPETGTGATWPPHSRRAVCACPTCRGTADSPDDEASRRPARDVAANGLFFDEFTTKRHFDPVVRTRSVVSTLSGIADPKEKTILMAENVDAVDYTLDPNPNAPHEEIYATAERKVAVTWAPTSTFDGGAAGPVMTPPRDTLQVNRGVGTGDGTNYDQARPSSRHPGGFNVAFAGSQVQFLKETISYYVYARLMAPDDKNAGLVDVDGKVVPMAAAFSDRSLTDADVNP